MLISMVDRNNIWLWKRGADRKTGKGKYAPPGRSGFPQLSAGKSHPTHENDIVSPNWILLLGEDQSDRPGY